MSNNVLTNENACHNINMRHLSDIMIG